MGEGFTRIFFSEFSKNQVFKKVSDYERVSGGKNQFFSKFQDLNYRISKSGEKAVLTNNKKTVWFIGDSVTNGFGLNFTDTYYFNLSKILESQGIELNFIATSNYGSNLYSAIDIFNKNKNLFNDGDLIIYQFNYNDIIENPMTLLKNDKNNNISIIQKLINKTARVRYAYLNRSTFLRTLQHYGGILTKKTSGTCENRGIHSLGPYSFAFGSKAFDKQSKKTWNFFNKNLELFNELSKANKNKLIVLLSPISLQIPYHEKNNILNYDLGCATIDPNLNMKNILNELKITYSDPLPLFQKVAKMDFDEKNPSPLFLLNDTNHPNAKGHLLLAYSLINKILENI